MVELTVRTDLIRTQIHGTSLIWQYLLCVCVCSNWKRGSETVYFHEKQWLEFCLGAILTLPFSVVIWRNMNHLNIPQNTTLVHFYWQHHADWTDKQKVASMPKTMVRYRHSRAWEINMKLQGPDTSVKCLEVQGSEECQDIPSEMKAKLLRLAAFTTKKEVGTF